MAKLVTTYNPNNFPTIPGGQDKYLKSELAKVSVSITKLAEAIADLTARVTALEGP